MFRQNSPCQQLQGFSVYQPALGAQLIFFPAVGSRELEQLIDAYLPGPASAKEKRAAVSMDFLKHSRLTGENFKFYTADTTAASPESISSASWESPYSPDFETSPGFSELASSWSFASLPQQQAPISAAPVAQNARRQQKSSVSARSSTDVSSLPGMKILTKDGRDVTNSASRGCKTKEQRDHAHLMRIIKACDSCRRKKIRCDPSHKKRAAASQIPTEAKPVKKAKKAVSQALPPRQTQAAVTTAPSQLDHAAADNFLALDPSHAIGEAATAVVPPPPLDDWEQFIQLDQDFTQPLSDIDTFLGSSESLSPVDGISSGSSSGTSSSSPARPVTPANTGLGLNGVVSNAQIQKQQPTYLDLFGSGAQYVDFNLFSPQSNFLDEEPISLKSAQASASPWVEILSPEAKEKPTEPLLETESALSVSALFEPSTLSSAHDATGFGPGGVLHGSPTLLSGVEISNWPTLNANASGIRAASTTVEPDIFLFPTSHHRLLSSTSPLLPGEDRELLINGVAQANSNASESPLQALVRRSGQDGLHRLGQSRLLPGHSSTNIEASTDHSRLASSYSVSQPDIRPPSARVASAPGRLIMIPNYARSEAGNGSNGRKISLPTSATPQINRREVENSAGLFLSEVRVATTERLINATKTQTGGIVDQDVVSSDASNSSGFVLATPSLTYSVASNTHTRLVLLALGSLLLALLTLQAGSAKMPEGLFGLVIGGVVSLAQALRTHTQPRSSKPTPGDLLAPCALGKGVTGKETGHFQREINTTWQRMRSSLGSSISGSERSIVSETLRVSCWQT